MEGLYNLGFLCRWEGVCNPSFLFDLGDAFMPEDLHSLGSFHDVTSTLLLEGLYNLNFL